MKDSEMARQSIELAVCAVEYYKWLVAEKREFVMSKQILRSATSIGANIHEAHYANSRADFIAKMHIALKECSETEYWLLILKRTDFYDARFQTLDQLVIALKRMLIATLNTSKKGTM